MFSCGGNYMGMEILGGLILLDEQSRLPAPWFNRPALGLATNTSVQVGVVRSNASSEAPPDILITPLDTALFHSTSTMTVDLEEGSGALFKVLREMKGFAFNIALEESVTHDQRTRHRTTLVLEPPRGDLQITKEEKEDNRAKYKDLNDALATQLQQSPARVSWHWMTEELMDFEKEDNKVVKNGRINIPEVLEWIKTRYAGKFSDRFDFNRIVVSSPTDGRYIRYIFPRRGAFEATISHRDIPGALAHICQVFQKLHYNILLSRLSRTEQNVEKSEFVAICEPLDVIASDIKSTKYASEVAAKIIAALGEPPSAYSLQLHNNEISLGETIANSTAPPKRRSPNIIEISPQTEIQHFLTKYTFKEHAPVFVSYRSCIKAQAFGKLLCNGIFDTIKAAGLEAWDGFDRPKPLEDSSAADVRARLYRSGAAVFVAIGENEKPGLSENQFIEWGYIYGQSKPIALIVRRGDESVIQRFMIPQHSYITFDPGQATQEVDNVIKELATRISSWRV